MTRFLARPHKNTEEKHYKEQAGESSEIGPSHPKVDSKKGGDSHEKKKHREDAKQFKPTAAGR